MASTYSKPHGLKYTDMAKYVDEHLQDIAEADAHPEVEAKIYEYIYHLFYALSYKAGYFKDDLHYYDDYALYSAGEMYSMILKKLNRGERVKSILNYVKAVLYPFKVNFQRMNFRMVINPEIGQDTSALLDTMKNAIQSRYSMPLQECWQNAVQELPGLVSDVLNKTPFKNDVKMKHKLRISILLTFLNQITLPNKMQQKMQSKPNKLDKREDKILVAYQANAEPAILWHLDSTYSNYVKVLVTRVKKAFSQSLRYYIHGDDLSDEMLDDILKTAYEGNGSDTNSAGGDE